MNLLVNLNWNSFKIFGWFCLFIFIILEVLIGYGFFYEL